MCKLSIETGCFEHGLSVALSPRHVFNTTKVSPMGNSHNSLGSPLPPRFPAKKSRSAHQAPATLRVPRSAADFIPLEVWGRVLDYLTTANPVSRASGVVILSALHNLLPSLGTLGQVCHAWRDLLRRSTASQPEALHQAIFGTPGGRAEMIERMQVLESYSSLMDDIHLNTGGSSKAAAEADDIRRQVDVRHRMKATLGRIRGMKWQLDIEFAGLFWNHASPPSADLTRLETYCNNILGLHHHSHPSTATTSRRDEELCTTVASAIQDPSLIQEFDNSKFIVLHMNDRRSSSSSDSNKAQQQEDDGGALSSFEVVFDQVGGWRRANSISFTGTKVLKPGEDSADDDSVASRAGGGGDGVCILAGLPWEVHLELGNCSSLCSSRNGRDKDMVCLLSLSSYVGGHGTELLLLGRLPQFAFTPTEDDDDDDDDSSMTL